MQITNGYGVTAAIDSVGGTVGTKLALCVQSGGETLGLLSGGPVNWSTISLNAKINSFSSFKTWEQADFYSRI